MSYGLKKCEFLEVMSRWRFHGNGSRVYWGYTIVSYVPFHTRPHQPWYDGVGGNMERMSCKKVDGFLLIVDV